MQKDVYIKDLISKKYPASDVIDFLKDCFPSRDLYNKADITYRKTMNPSPLILFKIISEDLSFDIEITIEPENIFRIVIFKNNNVANYKENINDLTLRKVFQKVFDMGVKKMAEIMNVKIFGINRAINAINNSFNVGNINTDVKPTEKRINIAKALGKNKEELQSHDAWLAGCIVQFEMNCFDKEFFEKMVSNKFFEVSPLTNENYFVTTNFRALKNFILKYPEEIDFKKDICDKVENFSKFTEIKSED